MCTDSLTPAQEKLRAAHGTPLEFAKALILAIGDVSKTEALDALNRYEEEWRLAGLSSS
jgi:hypothetical protein